MNGPATRPPDQRRHPRTRVGRSTRYQHEQVTLEGVVHELSEGGARLGTAQPLRPAAKVRLSLPLDEWGGSPDGCELEGVVVRSSRAEAALAFSARLLPRHMLRLRDFVWRHQRT